jgi:hypothetical protein
MQEGSMFRENWLELSQVLEERTVLAYPSGGCGEDEVDRSATIDGRARLGPAWGRPQRTTFIISSKFHVGGIDARYIL